MAAGVKWLVGLFGALALIACRGAAPEPVAYLVRHAEKTAETPDPGLSAAGESRADALADRLTTARITAIWSTDYARTRATAAPLAARLGLAVEFYDPRDLTGFAAQLKTATGNVLVVGHSNTTPDLVAALDGDPGAPIDEAGEYDRLYIVGLDSGKTELRRYGDAAGAPASDE